VVYDDTPFGLVVNNARAIPSIAIPMRLLLDTNVWGMLVKHDGVQRLRRMTRARGAEVLVCPAVVYELLRTPDPVWRDAQIQAATLGVWTRMRTEVYSACEDFRRVVSTRRPSWLLVEPDLRAYHQLRGDWSQGGGFWRRARHDTAAEAQRVLMLGGDVLARLREEAQQRRADMGKKAHFDSFPLEWIGRPRGGLLGWAGGEVELWRLLSLGMWWSSLVKNPRAAFHDWLAPFLDLRAVASDEASFNSLWLYEVDVEEVPRDWLRWAVMQLQSVRQVTPGTPGDNQIAAYAYDCDLFLTGDKAMVAILDRVRPHAPKPVAQARRLRPDIDPVDQVETVIDEFD
jgi:predicted nucleic acid-binding protein